MRTALRLLAVFFLCLATSELSARIISYAPVSDQHAVPGVQSRLARHYLLVESSTAVPLFFGGGIATAPVAPPPRGQLVLYDSRGEQPPRILLSGGAPEPSLVMAAMWEDSAETPRIFVVTDASINGDNLQRSNRLLYSPDAGRSWRAVSFAPGSSIAQSTFYEDVGGPFVRSRGSQVRLGDAGTPFVFSVHNDSAGSSRIYGLRADGTPILLADMLGAATNVIGGVEPHLAARLVGSDRTGTRFLITGKRANAPLNEPEKLRILHLDGRMEDVAPITNQRSPWLEGWIAPDGGVYLEDRGVYGRRSLWFYRGGQATEIAVDSSGPATSTLTFFAVPTFDYRGAWIIHRGSGQPTVLSRHHPGGPLVEQWRDISGPEVEALHAGSSGQRLLVQVHRPRPMADQRLFIDPALAIWEVGQPAPRQYDELYLIEGPGKGFVHLDVEAVATGEPFVFDSASITTAPPPPGQISPAPGGAEVIQEWGVVRASLQQRLVLPGIARIAGAYNSFWRSDVTLRNPSAETVSVHIRYVPTYAGMQGGETTIELAPREIRVVRDALKTLFGLDEGGGAFFVTPGFEHAIHVTSRTYTGSAQGTYGMGMGGIDIFAAAGPRFPVTFSGAFQGPDFRTNVIVTDTSGRGTGVELQVAGTTGIRPQSTVGFAVPPGGQSQFNSVGSLLNLASWETGALVFRPLTAEAIGSVIVIDNRTNDPTYFPPDLPAPYVRTIPVIGHLDGANGSKFRSDLFLFNPSDRVKTVILAAKTWDQNSAEIRLNFTLLPHESKIIRDVLFTAFAKTGLARLRYQSGDISDSIGIRVTSRTYTEEQSGATYGLEIPPLNSFQSAGAGDSLEILGAFGDRDFRTNLALVELGAFADGSTVRVRIEIIDDQGAIIDVFETNVPVAGGIQLLDLFRARGLGDGPAAALIRVSPFGGMVGAFATVVDNGTNDPTYLAAALASR